MTKYKISDLVLDNFNQKVGQQASSSMPSVEVDTEQCGNCKHYIPTKTIARHEAYCSRHNGCGVVLRIEESKNHIHCDRCGQAFQQVELEKHMKVFHEPLQCPRGIILEKEQMVGCLSTTLSLLYSGVVQIYFHLSCCTAPCDSCGRSVMLKDMDIHPSLLIKKANSDDLQWSWEE